MPHSLGQILVCAYTIWLYDQIIIIIIVVVVAFVSKAPSFSNRSCFMYIFKDYLWLKYDINDNNDIFS